MREAACVWLDLDDDAERGPADAGAELPPATLVTATSAGRYQVIRRFAAPPPIDVARRMLRGLARRFGGDRAATDACRLLRLPGFANTKYPDLPLSRRIVRIVGGTQRPVDAEAFEPLADAPAPTRASDRPRAPDAGTDDRCDPDPPGEIAGVAELVLLWRGIGGPPHWTASERDLAPAHAFRRRGVAYGRAFEILRASPNRSAGRPKPHIERYLSLTLFKARYRPA